jgi:hypothetical protein
MTSDEKCNEAELVAAIQTAFRTRLDGVIETEVTDDC